MTTNLINCIKYELLSMYYEELGDNIKSEQLAEKSAGCWYKLTTQERELLNSRGGIAGFVECLEKSMDLLSGTRQEA